MFSKSALLLLAPLCAPAADLTVEWRAGLDPACINIQTSPDRATWTTVATRGTPTAATLTINNTVFVRIARASGETCGAVDGPFDPMTCRYVDNTAAPGTRGAGRRGERR